MRVLLYATLVFFILVPLVAGVFFFINISPAQNIRWGVTFAHSQAEVLGTDWRASLSALLDDLGVRHFRIPIYWDELEQAEGEFNFSIWDEQLEEIEKRGGTAILAIGQKLPRWPECRVPAWLSGLPEQEQNERVLIMLEEAVARYRGNPTVISWQVENEPIHNFGACDQAPLWRGGTPDKAMLDLEIELVRKLDPSRDVIITDTAQFSLWYEASKRTNIIGGSVYRILYNRHLGYVKYRLPAQFYALKAQLINLVHPGTKIIISELQAEPWPLAERISDVSIEEQYETMSPAQFRENIELARATGFDEIYLWGGEWFYWLTTQGETEIWDEAEKLFIESKLP